MTVSRPSWFAREIRIGLEKLWARGGLSRRTLKDAGCTMAPVKVVRPRISFADLERAPEDGRRYELYDGEVFVVPAPLPRHQVVQLLIAEMLHHFAAEHGGFAVASPIDIVFSDYDVLQPDVVFFSAARANLVDLDRVIRNPPDLCVEVIAPSTQDRDRGRKMQMFARFGVPEYWIVDCGESRSTASIGRPTRFSPTSPARASSSRPP